MVKSCSSSEDRLGETEHILNNWGWCTVALKGLTFPAQGHLGITEKALEMNILRHADDFR